MVATSLSINSRTSGWLRGAWFDSTYIFGTVALALLCGSVVISTPQLFLPVFVLNGWLLGYHHVVSTYTRLTFDSESFKQHRFLVLWLPFIVLGGVVLLSAMFGAWILVSGYLYWQWWHYTRQSYGVSRIYARRAGISAGHRLNTLMIYAVPLTGILYRSYQAPQQFLFSDVKVLPVPFWLVAASGVFATVVFGCWLLRQIDAWINGNLEVAHSAYLFSHVLCFTLGYILISDINHGWLVLNVWHNSQYILTVWLFNHNRFKRETGEKHRFLSYISQRKNVASYFAACLLISTAFYGAISVTLSWVSPAVVAATSLPVFAVVYQAINFHHYIVDAVIWKVRKKTVRTNLGIAS